MDDFEDSPGEASEEEEVEELDEAMSEGEKGREEELAPTDNGFYAIAAVGGSMLGLGYTALLNYSVISYPNPYSGAPIYNYQNTIVLLAIVEPICIAIVLLFYFGKMNNTYVAMIAWCMMVGGPWGALIFHYVVNRKEQRDLDT